MRNVQRRLIPAPPEAVGRVVDELAGRGVTTWPTPAWPPLVLDNGLAIGSKGGHGPIRYSVTAYEPRRSITFTFDPVVGLDGWHTLRIAPHGDAHAMVVHTIEARAKGRMTWLWPLVVRWLHEGLVRDLLDNVEREVVGELAGPSSRWSRWVVVLRKLNRTSIPPAGVL